MALKDGLDRAEVCLICNDMVPIRTVLSALCKVCCKYRLLLAVVALVLIIAGPLQGSILGFTAGVHALGALWPN